MDDRLHDGYDDMIVNNGSPSLSFLSNDNEENAFGTRHAPSNPDAIATTTAAATADTATDNEHDDNYDVQTHPPPQPTAAVWGETGKATGSTPKQVSMSSVISSAVKISLRAYFEGSNWLLNKALRSWAEFLCGPLGDIVRQYCLEKTQVAR